MANSGYRDEWVTNWDTLRFQWWESEQSIAGNYTTIGWKLELIATNDGRMSSSAAKSWWVNVNGSYYQGTNNVSIGNNTTKELASGYTTIYHSSDGTKEFSYSFSQYFGITFSGRKIESVGGSSIGTLTSIPRKATFRSPEAYDFNDETSPTIYFNHPAGSALELQARIMCGETAMTTWRIIDGTKDSYTFPVADFQANIWTKTIENKSTYVDVTFELATWMGDHFEYATSSVKRCTLINYLPVLDPTVIDEGSVSTQFTKNPNTMIRDYNVIKASFNDTGDSPRTYARKGASIVGKSVTCGNNVPLFGDGYFEYVHDNTFTFSITDSRGQTVPYSITMPAVYYFYPTCEINHSIDLYPNNIANINVTLSGNVFNNYFGDPNAGAAYNVLHLYYRYYKSSEQAPTEWTEISATDIAYNGNSYSCNNIKIQDVDYKDSYVVEARVTDNIAYYGVNANTQRITITPVFDWGEDDFNFNVPVTIEGKQAVTYGADRIARAYTQETDIAYETNSYIKLFRNNSPTDLYNEDIATFDENGLITIKKDMTALVNVHIVSSNSNGRSWIRLMNHNSNWRYAECIAYGSFTTSQITIILKLSADTQIGVLTSEPININSSGLVGSYIEIMEL